VVTGHFQRTVLLELEDPDAVHASEGVREPQLYNADSPQLSFARAMELDRLCWAVDRGVDPEFCPERFLKSEFVSLRLRLPACNL